MINNYKETENQIANIFSSIKFADSFESAQQLFSSLEPIQHDLAITLFRDNSPMTQRLERFVRDFDRVDDMRLRTYMFDKIRDGSYSF